MKEQKHLKMFWLKHEPKRVDFPTEYEVISFDGTMKQKKIFYQMWNEKNATDDEADDFFKQKFYNVPDCNPTQDMFFVLKNSEYIASITAIYHPKQNLGHVHYVVIKKEYRQKRLSYPLMYLAIKKFFEVGAKGAYLFTQDWRLSAIKCYLGCGFFPQINEFWPWKKSKIIARWKTVYNNLNLNNLKILNSKNQFLHLKK